MRKGILLWSVIVFGAAGCVTPPTTQALPTLEFVTATLPSTAAPAASATSLPPTAAPTIEPIPGTTTSEVNVRMEPSTASPSLGTIPPFTAIQVEGKESFGYWVRILYGGNTGWVRAEYIQASAEVPVLGVEAGAGSGARGAILRGVNVRSGPGKDYDSLGLLNQYDVVDILGRDSSGEWLRIEFLPAADGAGWVAAEYMQTDNIDTLSVVDGEEQVIGTDIPTQTVEPALEAIFVEGDSADAPLALFNLSPGAARSAEFQGTVPAIGGDKEDWVGFSAGFPRIHLQFLCDPGTVQVELIPAVAVSVSCEESQTIPIEPNLPYLIKITPLTDGMAAYEIRITVSD